MKEVGWADLKALWIPNQAKKKGFAQLQESARGKEPPQSSKGSKFNQAKIIFIASGTHLVCEEVEPWAWKPASVCIIPSVFATSFQRNSLCKRDTGVDQTHELTLSRINVVTKSSFPLWVRWQVARQLQKLLFSHQTSSRGPIARSTLSLPGMRHAFEMIINLPPVCTNEPDFKEKKHPERRGIRNWQDAVFFYWKIVLFSGPIHARLCPFPTWRSHAWSNLHLINYNCWQVIKNLISFSCSPSF